MNGQLLYEDLFKEVFIYLARFMTLSEEVKQHIRKIAQVLEYGAGQILISPMDIPFRGWFLFRGLAMQYSYNETVGKIVTRFHKGKEAIIPPGFIDQQPTDIYLELLENSTLISITHSQLMDLFVRFPEINHLFRLVDAHYVKQEREHAFLLGMHSAADRVRYFMDNRKSLFTRVPYKYLASYLGMTPYTFSHIRKQLNKEKNG